MIDALGSDGIGREVTGRCARPEALWCPGSLPWRTLVVVIAAFVSLSSPAIVHAEAYCQPLAHPDHALVEPGVGVLIRTIERSALTRDLELLEGSVDESFEFGYGPDSSWADFASAVQAQPDLWWGLILAALQSGKSYQSAETKFFILSGEEREEKQRVLVSGTDVTVREMPTSSAAVLGQATNCRARLLDAPGFSVGSTGWVRIGWGNTSGFVKSTHVIERPDLTLLLRESGPRWVVQRIARAD